VRRATILSIAIHLCVIGTLLIRFPQRSRQTVKFTSIPVNLLRVNSPRPIGSHRSGEATARSRLDTKPAVKKPPKASPQQKTKQNPPSAANARPVPKKKLKPQEKATPPDSTAAHEKPILREEIVLAGGVQGALEMTVDGPMSAYTYYLMTVRDKVASRWEPPSGIMGKEVSTIINFRIDRSGKVTASYVEEPSGTGVFDAASLRAVAQSSPLPPLPEEYVGDWLGIHLRFVYNE
jgi:TonB family protein